MHKGFFTDVMQHRPALFATMLAFNGLGSYTASTEQRTQADHAAQAEHTEPSPYGNQPLTASQSDSVMACMQALSQVQGMSTAHMATLAASPVVQRHMLASSQNQNAAASSPTFGQGGVAPFWDFAEESRRLVFLSSEELTTLLHFFGVAIHAKSYAHLVRHADVVALRRALGAEAYAYGLVRGRFQLGRVGQYFYARSQALGNTGQSLDVDTILHGITRDGDVALGLCMATWPQSLQERVCASLGRPIIPILDADAATVRGVWFALKKLLLREVEPQWAPCFD